MKSQTSPKPFSEAVFAALRHAPQAMAEEVLRALGPVVDDNYRKTSIRILVNGREIFVPRRLHFLKPDELKNSMTTGLRASQCLLTRSTDGQIRQRALEQLLPAHEPWVIPFVALLTGEYVVEIVEVIRDALPALDRVAYANFVRENRPTMRVLRQKAASYWNDYYRHEYPDRRDYPGMIVLNRFDQWAG